jgi:hypothetical protein
MENDYLHQLFHTFPSISTMIHPDITSNHPLRASDTETVALKLMALCLSRLKTPRKIRLLRPV